MPTGISLDSATRLGGTWEKDGIGTAVSEAAGTDADNLETVAPEDIWSPADTDPANSRLHFTADADFDLGQATLAGLKGMTGNDAAVRIRADDRFMEDHCIGLTSGSTAVDITETASWTLSWMGRLAPGGLQASTDDICEVKLTGASSNSTRLVQIAVGAAGNPLIRLERMGGATNEEDFTGAAQIDDCAEHQIDVSFADAGGSGGTATVYLDGTSIGTVATTETFGSGTVQITTSGNHYVGQVELWNVALSATELAIFRGSRRDGRENDLECGLNCNEGSGTTVTDVTGGHNLSLSAATWDTIRNPSARYEVAAQPPWQPWRRRNALQCNSAGAGTVQSGTNLSTSPIVHIMALLRFPNLAGSTTPQLIRFGTAATASNYAWNLSMRNNGQLILEANRHHASSEVTIFSDNALDDGAWYRVSALIGWGGAMSMSIDGTAQADTDTAPTYSAQSSQRMTVHVGSYDFDIGYLLVSSRPYTHAQADQILQGVTPVLPTDPGVELLYHFHEGSGTSIPNATGAAGGSGGDLTITATPGDAQWLTDKIENTSAGITRVDFSALTGPTVTPRAPSNTNVRARYVLIELYDPEASTISLGSVLLWKMLWPAVGGTEGGGEPPGIQLVGPSYDYSKAQMPASDGVDPNDIPSLNLSLLTDAERAEVLHYLNEGRRMHSADGTPREVRPMLLDADRGTTNGRQWLRHLDAAVIVPELTNSTEVGAHGDWRQAVVVRGRRLPW